jgi:hypothetical protein
VARCTRLYVSTIRQMSDGKSRGGNRMDDLMVGRWGRRQGMCSLTVFGQGNQRRRCRVKKIPERRHKIINTFYHGLLVRRRQCEGVCWWARKRMDEWDCNNSTAVMCMHVLPDAEESPPWALLHSSVENSQTQRLSPVSRTV